MTNRYLVRGTYVLTDASLLPDDGFLHDGAVLVEGDKITAIGDFGALEKANPDIAVEGSPSDFIIPGLVNAHTHGRGLPVTALGVIDDHVDPFLVDYLTVPPLDVYLDTLYANMRLLRSGVTTVIHSGLVRAPGDMRAELEHTIRAYRDCGMRVACSVPMQDIPGLVYRDEENLIQSLDEPLRARVRTELGDAGFTDAGPAIEVFEWALDAYADDPGVNILAGPNGPDWASDDLWRRIVDLVGRRGGGIHTHCAESAAQRDASISIFGEPPVNRLERLGALGPGTSLAHCVWIDESEQDLLAAAGATVCALASSNLRLAQGVAPIAGMVEKGIPVAIGTDSFTLASDDDFLAEVRLAGAVHRMPRALGPTWFPRAPDVLRMATVNGAAAAGFHTGVGSLVEGGPADIVILDGRALSGPYLSDDTPIPEAILAFASHRHVSSVIVAGEPVYRDGRHLTIDADDVAGRLAEIARRDPDPAFRRFAETMRDVRPAVERHYRDWSWGFSPEPGFMPNTAKSRNR